MLVYFCGINKSLDVRTVRQHFWVVVGRRVHLLILHNTDQIMWDQQRQQFLGCLFVTILSLDIVIPINVGFRRQAQEKAFTAVCIQ